MSNKLTKPKPQQNAEGKPRPATSPDAPNITVDNGHNDSDGDSIEQLGQFFDGLAEWKDAIYELGPEFNHIYNRLDGVEDKYNAALDRTSTIANTFFYICEDVVSECRNIADTSRPSEKEKTRAEEKIGTLANRCDRMAADCQECVDSFLRLGDELVSIQDELNGRIIVVERELKKKEAFDKRACAALVGAFFSFGTALVAIPLAISVVAPIAAFYFKNSADLHTKKLEQPSRELHNLKVLDEGINIGKERVETMVNWWDNIRTEVHALRNELVNGGLQWGSSPKMKTTTRQWKELVYRLKRHSENLDEVKSYQSSKQTMSSQRRSLSVSSGKSSRSNSSKVSVNSSNSQRYEETKSRSVQTPDRERERGRRDGHHRHGGNTSDKNKLTIEWG
ncbi:hypothetical protein EW145_g6436 [Phellinidium pouzarii]|uniref:Uncharacterized protein n=1 Tax=Phellinidium pouzarii TaxID=167371 RepID=A0A4S4KWU3_9AGAM|nr:hypothetical protein EW145_g6436 [Phellinidium pouzarii]